MVIKQNLKKKHLLFIVGKIIKSLKLIKTNNQKFNTISDTTFVSCFKLRCKKHFIICLLFLVK